MTPSDMGEACSLCTNIEVIYHYVHMRDLGYVNYDYLVVKKLMILKMVANLILLLLINLTWLITCLK
jgi:hypothetical protein